VENNSTIIDAYVEVARSTAIYPETAKFFYPVLGLAGEFGETMDEIFQGVGLKLDTPKSKIRSELGDCLWYITNTALDLGFTFRDLTDIVTGGLRCETFEDVCFQRLKPRDNRSPYLKATIYIGQLAEVAKKGLRDGYGTTLTMTKRAVCVTALAQLLVCLCEICEKHGVTIDEVAANNNAKLTSRMERGKLKGDGNDR
jgi:NTP pyrophosphatase (non-canonical NTP hydrolase)